MKINRLLYIGSILLLAGCTSEADFSDTLSGNGKTPLMIEATLNTGRAQTRASGASFANGDVLKAYVQHLDGDGNAIVPEYGKKLVSITYDGTNFKSDSFWDDFSNSSSDATDLRTDEHGLRSLYGYCYNGGENANIQTSLVENTGVLVWKNGSLVDTYIDQSTATKVQNADLLWSPTQTKVVYAHGATHDANHNTLTIPYTHAMSQITVKVIADNSATGGFVAGTNPLASTILMLNGMNTESTFTAPTTVFSPLIQETGGKIKSVKMYAKEPYPSSNEFQREFVAVVAPGTKLKEGDELLHLFNVHGNNYKVMITSTMLADDTWGTGHSGENQIGGDEGNHYVVTQPGKNYYLTVTVQKSAVQAHSTLADWTSLNATADGEIYFPDDVEVIIDDSYPDSSSPVNVEAIDKNHFVDNASFSLYRLLSTSGSTANSNYTYATVSTFTNDDSEADDDKWTNNPELFWLNNTDRFYYRALAKFNSSTGEAPNIVNNIEKVGTLPSDKGTAVSQGAIDGGKDILWGTTAKHFGYAHQITYDKGAAIPPRTHGVPIVFQHAMSKISFTLTTTDDATVENTNAKVNLEEATIAISNIYTSAEITLHSGEMNYTVAKVVDAIPATTSISNMIVVPQTFADNALVTITLPNQNNAVYKIPLNDCVVSGGSTPITAWEGGKNYAYTIHVEKEKIKFNALVKDWDNVVASGNAVLNW